MHDRDKLEPPIPLKELIELRGGALSRFRIDLSAPPVAPGVAYPPAKDDPPPPPPPPPNALAIDFGTSAIALAVAGNSTEVLRFRRPGAPETEQLLEAPMGRRRELGRARLEENYRLDTVALGDPSVWSYYPCLKRRIELLAREADDDDWQAQAALDVAGVCIQALSMAEDEQRTPLRDIISSDWRVYVSVPNTFPEAGVEVIREGVAYAVAALVKAGRVPTVYTLLEAEAVAYGELLRPRLDGRGRLADPILVIDAGAGTTDASILRRVEDVLQVVAHAGLPVGGIDLDAFIASLGGSLTDLEPQDLSQRLRAAQEEKERHWRQGTRDLQEASDALARAMIDPVSQTDELVSTYRNALEMAHRRYIALAVHALVLSLPEAELSAVRTVILSGRSSMVIGFREAVCQALQARGLPEIEPVSGTDVDRKLAVVLGIGAYHQAAGSKVRRRPLRATFPVVLDYSLEEEQQIMSPGHPLMDGWGVVAWYQPGNGATPASDWIVRSRLITLEVLDTLRRAGHLKSDGEHNELEHVWRWSRMFLTRFVRRPPFSARLAYDFLSRRVALEIDGVPEAVASHSAGGSGSAGRLQGRFHPIHQLAENWFETYPR